MERCKGGRVENPFNGNDCGYSVNIWLDTRLSLDSLIEYYGPLYRLPSTIRGLVVTAPYATHEQSGLAKIEFLALGDEGFDLRCT